jgi:hypothetical protein
MLKILAEYETDTTSAKFKDISLQIPASLLGVCCNHRTLMDESRMVRTHMGTHSKSKNGRSAYDVPYDTTL